MQSQVFKLKKHHNGGNYDSWVMFQTFWIQKNSLLINQIPIFILYNTQQRVGLSTKISQKASTHTNHDTFRIHFCIILVWTTLLSAEYCVQTKSAFLHIRNNISSKKLTICGKLIGGITVFNMAIIVKENSTFNWNGQLPYWQRYSVCISSTDQ